MTTQLTPNLRLRLTPEMTADSQYNLLRIDSLGSRFVVGQDENVYVRSIGDVYLLPESPDVGGSDVGGLLTLGDDDRTLADSIDVQSWSRTFQLTGALRLANDAGTFYLGLQAPALSASTTWTLPSSDGPADSALVTDGAGNLAWTPITGLTLPALLQFHMWVGDGSNQATPVNTATTGDISGSSVTGLSIKPAVVTNAMVAPAAAIAYSKLNLVGSVTNGDLAGGITYSKLLLTNSILNADVNAAAAIAYSKLLLTNSILNADINAAAAIDYTKLAALTASRALVSSGAGIVTPSLVTSTELGYVSGVASAIQTQLDAKTGGIGTTVAGATAGSILFAGVGGILAQDNAQLFWDNTNNRLGIGTTTPSYPLHIAEGGIYTASTSAGSPGLLSFAGDSSSIFGQNTSSAIYEGTARFRNLDTTGPVLSLRGATAGVLAMAVPASVTDYKITWPSAQGAASTILRNDGTGILSWAANPVEDAINSGTIDRAPSEDAVYKALYQAPDKVSANIAAVTGASYTILITDKTLIVSTAGVCSIQLPDPATRRSIRIKDVAGTRQTAAITVLRFASESIDGLAASRLLQTNYGSWTFESNGSNWFITE